MFTNHQISLLQHPPRSVKSHIYTITQLYEHKLRITLLQMSTIVGCFSFYAFLSFLCVCYLVAECKHHCPVISDLCRESEKFWMKTQVTFSNAATLNHNL